MRMVPTPASAFRSYTDTKAPQDYCLHSLQMTQRDKQNNASEGRRTAGMDDLDVASWLPFTAGCNSTSTNCKTTRESPRPLRRHHGRIGGLQDAMVSLTGVFVDHTLPTQSTVTLSKIRSCRRQERTCTRRRNDRCEQIPLSLKLKVSLYPPESMPHLR